MALTTGISSNDLVYGRARGGIYQSPYNDLAKAYLPKNMAELLQWCQFYFENNPIIQQAIRRMSSYPITNLLIHDDQDKSKKSEEDIISDVKMRDHCIDVALHYFTYGNAFCSVIPAYKRYYRCEICHKDNSQDVIIQSRGYSKSIFEIKKVGKEQKLLLDRCHHCASKKAPVEPIDIPLKSLDKIKLLMWHPRNIRIEFNPVSGDKSYRYIIPELLRKDILAGNTFSIFTTPKLFIDAVIRDRDILMNKDLVYHFARNSTCSSNGWGLPIIQPVMRDLFYAQVIKKASEAIAVQHINPLMVLYPADQGNSNIYEHLDLGQWSATIEDQVKRWRRDPNHILVMPTPVGVEYIGGQHKGLDPHPLLEQINGEIAAGLGVPREFLFGGTSFSAASVALRMLENDFSNLRTSLSEYLNDFLIPALSRVADIVSFNVKFTSMRTADDVQLKEIMLRLNEVGKLSNHTVLNELGFDPSKEQHKIVQEQKDMIDIQKKVSMDETGAAQSLTNVSIPANQLVSSTPLSSVGTEALGIFSSLIKSMDQVVANDFMMAIGEKSPAVYNAINDMMGNTPPGNKNQNKDKSASNLAKPVQGKTDMRPNPSQKPPRRDKPSV